MVSHRHPGQAPGSGHGERAGPQQRSRGGQRGHRGGVPDNVHYGTDTLAGVGVALAAVLLVALTIDHIAERRARPRRGDRPDRRAATGLPDPDQAR